MDGRLRHGERVVTGESEAAFGIDVARLRQRAREYKLLAEAV